MEKRKSFPLVAIGVSILPVCLPRGMVNRDDEKVSVFPPVLPPSLCCTRDLKSTHGRRQQALPPPATRTVIPVESTRRISLTSRHRPARRPSSIFYGKQATVPVPIIQPSAHQETHIFCIPPTLRILYCVVLRRDGQEWMMRLRRKHFENWTDFPGATVELGPVLPVLDALSA